MLPHRSRRDRVTSDFQTKLDFRSYKFNDIKDDSIYDDFLHDALKEVFRQDSLNSQQIKQLVRDKISITQRLLRWKPCASLILSDQEELRNLSLLWMTALLGYRVSAKLLVHCGADVNEPFGSQDPQILDEKCTVLHLLLQMASPVHVYDEQLVCLLTDYGADVQARDSSGRTVLHLALEHGRVKPAEVFMDKGANVNVVDKYGNTPLIHAVQNSNSINLVPLLLRLGADASAKDKKGLNALYYLTRLRDGDYADLAKALINRGASPDVGADSMHCKAIHWAILLGKHELVKLYANNGANLNAQTIDGESPLHIAVGHAANLSGKSVADMVEILLEHDADVDLRKTRNGNTVLHDVCEQSQLPHGDCIRLLLSAGANVLAEDRHGRTPLELIQPRNLENINAPGIRRMLKALALRKAFINRKLQKSQPRIELREERIIKKYPMLWNYFRDCGAQLTRMKFAMFFKDYTLFDVLDPKRHARMAELMSNPNFEANFQLYDLNAFFMYADDLRQAFQRAQVHKICMPQWQKELQEVFKIKNLPELTVKNIVSYCTFPACCNRSSMLSRYPDASEISEEVPPESSNNF